MLNPFTNKNQSKKNHFIGKTDFIRIENVCSKYRNTLYLSKLGKSIVEQTKFLMFGQNFPDRAILGPFSLFSLCSGDPG